jgi:subtilisin family serine protease
VQIEGVMIRRLGLIAAILLASAIPARAQNRIIVRTTLGAQGLQQALQPLCILPPSIILPTCTVVRDLGDSLNQPQLFLVTTSLNPAIFFKFVQTLPGILDTEIDQVISLVGPLYGLNVLAAPPALATAWNGYANQPAATKVNVSAAQSQFNVTGSGIVADIDTGVDPNHPAFAGVLLQGYDFIHNQPGASELSDFPSPHPACTPSTCTTQGQVNQSSVAFLDQSSAAFLDGNPNYAAFGHGTMVMGIIHLVAPTAKLLPLKAFGPDGTGFLSDILRAIYYAAGNNANAIKANVINMSFDFPKYSAELASALDSASQSTLICAASAGNDGQKADPSTPSSMVYPAGLKNVVMGVASTTDTDTRSTFSNYGNAIVWVAAPGEGIVTTYPFSTYAAGWGTSFSAPFVSGGAALLLNENNNKNNSAKTNESQAAAAIANADPLVPPDPDMGNGRLNLVKALTGLSPQDFTMSAAPPTSTIKAGLSATYSITVTPILGFNQPVSLSCGGLPPASTCAITPNPVALDGTNPATATLIVTTTARSAVPLTIPPRIRSLPPLVAVGLVYLLVYMAWLFQFTVRRFGQPPCQRPGLSATIGLFAILLYSYSCGGAAAPGNSPSQQTSPASFSLTLNPTSVNGGNASTGEIILSAPAPGGGAVFSLSSSNTSLATVPASVSIAAGLTMAAFPVSTNATSSSTTVTISASYSGSTQTAPLTITPQPPSGAPTLTSLSFNPNPVVGGLSSSGAVTLSGKAPSGGALVSLSSSNPGVVSVPASVTIGAGAASASFTASTSIVTAPTEVTVGASYAGVTQTSSLTVTPPLPPGTPAGTYTLTITGTSGNLSHNTTVSLTVN